MNIRSPLLSLALCAGLMPAVLPAQDQATARPASTRITDPKAHACEASNSYPFRDRSDYILKELDLRPGDDVVDIGAGDGWWTEQMAELVGETGVIHATEIEDRLVNRLTERFADTPQVKPVLCETDSTTLPENSVDLAFFSQVYHHIDEDGRVDYLRHLQKVVRRTGRICIIEKYSEISSRTQDHGTQVSDMVKTAEEAGWVMVRYELMPKTYHFVAFFVQKELFPPEPRRRGRRRGGE